MRQINFTKMTAAGNDFIVVSSSSLGRSTATFKKFAQKICDRKYGVGADGLLLLEKSKLADIKMRIFNADGSEARMCGNGIRCVALWVKSKISQIETEAGIIESHVKGSKVKVKLTEPRQIKLDIPLKINNRQLSVNFIDSGVPHAVVLVEGLDKIGIVGIGRQIRFHKKFAPQGANVDFVEILSKDLIKMRTYERGVEDETLACGTGAVASAIISNIKYQISNLEGSFKINVKTKGGEILKVYFDKINHKFKNVWLEGEASIVYKGVYNV